MMLRYFGQEVQCDRAEKGTDYIKCFLSGQQVAQFMGIASFDGYELSGGEWTVISPISPLEQLQEENRLLRAQVQAATERQDFVEDCIAEMAAQVYV